MVLPLDLLEKQLNNRLFVILKDGRTMEGKLVGFDQYMNIVLEEVDERHQEQTRRLGSTVALDPRFLWSSRRGRSRH
jgi:small nuclear ribonucleoprotein